MIIDQQNAVVLDSSLIVAAAQWIAGSIGAVAIFFAALMWKLFDGWRQSHEKLAAAVDAMTKCADGWEARHAAEEKARDELQDEQRSISESQREILANIKRGAA